MLRYRSFMLRYRMCFDIELFWRPRLMQGSGPRLQAAVWLRWYWVMIAVKMSLLPRPGAKPRPGGPGEGHSTSTSGARRAPAPGRAPALGSACNGGA